LVLWLQAASMKVFGINETALRFPSAAAGVGIAILLFWFCATALQSPLTGVSSILFYAASVGFVGPHMGRSADLDAVQTLLVTWYVLLFLKFVISDPAFFSSLAYWFFSPSSVRACRGCCCCHICF
jgi:4-amino-4-deoxy-L-arabinose transferase-like glycosyltransferase